MEPKNDIKINKNIDKFENKVVFNNSDRYRFVFKKQERLVAALYLITNLFADQEPLKWKIREQALIALTRSLELTNTNLEDRIRIVSACARSISELVALCRIAHISKYISDMNHLVLGKEFSVLLETIESIGAVSDIQGESILSSEFFSVDTPSVFKRTQNDSKGQAVLYNKQPQNDSQKEVENSIKDKNKVSRTDTIIGLLKLSKTLSIKDFSEVIKDCSEKTIQRELLSLVDEGVLKKTGERRWSVYSLK